MDMDKENEKTKTVKSVFLDIKIHKKWAVLPLIRGLCKLCVFLITIILHLNIEPLILNVINVELNFEPLFTEYYKTQFRLQTIGH